MITFSSGWLTTSADPRDSPRRRLVACLPRLLDGVTSQKRSHKIANNRRHPADLSRVHHFIACLESAVDSLDDCDRRKKRFDRWTTRHGVCTSVGEKKQFYWSRSRFFFSMRLQKQRRMTKKETRRSVACHGQRHAHGGESIWLARASSSSKRRSYLSVTGAWTLRKR